MEQQLKRLPAAFFATDSGKEPVREWLKEQSPEDRKIIGQDIALVEFSWPVGMPTCRPMGGGLWEVRRDISDGRIARVLFCIAHGSMVLLHALVKKTQKTPKEDLDKARNRQKKVEKNG